MPKTSNIPGIILKIIIAILIMGLIQWGLNKYIFQPQNEDAIREILEDVNEEQPEGEKTEIILNGEVVE